MAKKVHDFGALSAALGNSAAVAKLPDSKPKSSLSITARVDSGEGYPGGGSDSKYRKAEVKRLKKEIKDAQDQLKNWDHESVGKRAKRSLETDVAVKKARVMEHEAMMDNEDGEANGNY